MDMLLEFPEGQIHRECIENLKQNCIDHLNLLVCHLRHRGVEYKPTTLSVVKYINCIGDQYADLDKDSYMCPPQKSRENCPYLREQ